MFFTSSYSNNFYPTLTTLNSHPASTVGKSPAFLCAISSTNFNRQNDVKNNFTVSTANSVNWSRKLTRVNISGNSATLVSVGADTLEAKYY
jgi:hypothetical protein